MKDGKFTGLVGQLQQKVGPPPSLNNINSTTPMPSPITGHGDDIRRDDSQRDDTTGTIARQTTYYGDDSHRDDI